MAAKLKARLVTKMKVDPRKGYGNLSLDQIDQLFYQAVGFIKKSGGFEPGHLGKSGTGQRLEAWILSKDGKSFLDEQSRLVAEVDDMARGGKGGDVLCASLRAVTVLTRERAPQAAAEVRGKITVLGADDLQPLNDFVLLYARPKQAWTIKVRVEELDDEYLLAHPDACNVLIAWTVTCEWLMLRGLELARRAVFEKTLLRVQGGLPNLIKVRLGASAMHPQLRDSAMQIEGKVWLNPACCGLGVPSCSLWVRIATPR